MRFGKLEAWKVYKRKRYYWGSVKLRSYLVRGEKRKVSHHFIALLAFGISTPCFIMQNQYTFNCLHGQKRLVLFLFQFFFFSFYSKSIFHFFLTKYLIAFLA